MKTLLVSLFMLVFSNSAFAENGTDSVYTWLDAGMGSYVSSGSNGVLFGGALVGYKGKHFLKGRMLYGDEMSDLVDIGTDQPVENFWSVGMQYGRGVNTKSVTLYFSAGLGIVSGVKRGALISHDGGWFGGNNYERIEYFAPSVPVDVTISFKPFRKFGMGFSIVSDFNGKNSYTGFVLAISMGQQNP